MNEVENVIDFTYMFQLIHAWCKVQNVEPAEFIKMFEFDLLEEEKNEEMV